MVSNREGNYWSRRRFSRRRALMGSATSALGLGALSLVGCGDDDDDSSNGNGNGNGTGNGNGNGASPTVADNGGNGSETPTGQINVGFPYGAALQLWNPAMWVSGHQTMYRDHIADSMIGIEPDGEGFAYYNQLAEQVETSPDGLTVTFTIRPEAQFHDGSPVTSADVKHSYEFLTTDEARHARKAEWIRTLNNVETPDDQTAVVHLNTPYPILQTFNFMFPIISKAAFDSLGFDGFEEAPVCAGPYRMESGTKGENVTFRAVEGHYRQQPHIDTFVIHAVTEEATRVSQIQTGELDLAHISLASKSAVEGMDGVRISRVPANVPLTLVCMDEKVGVADSPLINPRVRQALSLAVNRQAIVDSIMEGEGELHGSFSTKFVPGFRELPADPYDLEEAKSILEAEGYGDGFSFDFHTSAPPPEYADVMVADWAQIGIQANMQPKDAVGIQDMVNTHATPGVYLQGTGANYIDPGQWGLFTYSDGAWSYHDSPELDALMDRVNTGTDPSGTLLSEEERNEAWGDAQEEMYEQRIMQVLWHQNSLAAVRENVADWDFIGGVGYILRIEHARLV